MDMIVIQVSGGLGNQLQQYAMYEKFVSLGKQVKLDVSEFQKSNRQGTYRKLELDRFPNISYLKSSDEEIEAILKNKSILCKLGRRLKLIKGNKYIEHSMYDQSVFNLNNSYIEGYFSCEKYYIDIVEQLFYKLQFPELTNGRNYDTAICMKNEESVSVHIRRSDYLNPENIEIFSNICTNEYYNSAIHYVEKMFSNPHYYVFSDDLEYVKQRFKGEKFTVVDWNTGNDSFYDMYLMSQCKYNICANSTFSFWGARLNQNKGKVMIRPLKQRNNAIYEPENIHQLWKNWILIDENGKIV